MERALALLVMGLLLAGCAQQAPPAGNGTPSGQETNASLTVHIKNFAFDPAVLTVKTGQTVTWVNDDLAQHTVTGASFDSGPISSGGTFQHTFTQAGDFDYACTIHPSMKGKVTVTG